MRAVAVLACLGLLSACNSAPQSAPAAAAAFEPAVSTAAVRAPAPLPALMPPPDSEAVMAGERRGMAELLSTTAATTDGQ